MQEYVRKKCPTVRLKWCIYLLTTNTLIFVILLLQVGTFQLNYNGSSNDIHRLWKDEEIPEKCEKEVELLILIPSSIWNFKQREAVRSTWGNRNSTDAKTKLVFLIGKVPNGAFRKRFEEEKRSYEDILQQDIWESYEGLTKKTIALLKWAHFNCPTVQYVLKAGDNIFINIQNLVNLLRKLRPTNSILGALNSNTRPFRDKGSKYVSKKKKYPPYLSGDAYIITGDIVTPLYNSSISVPSIMIEDIFITGICRKKIGADAINISGLDSSTSEGKINEGYFHNRTAKHHYSPQDMIEMWKELMENLHRQ